MRRTLILLIILTEAVSFTVSSQTSLRLDEVEVTARQTEIQNQAFRLVTEITQDDIAALPATTLDDILQSVTGLDIRTRGAHGAQADVSMRGGTFDQVMIMLNGICVSDAQTGHYAMNLPVPLSAIERIEVLQGAASSLIGANAFVGAVNIVTLQPDSDTYHVAMQGGMNRFAHVECTGGWQRHDWQVTASADYGHNNGYYAPRPTDKERTALDNTDLDIANIYLSARYKGLDLQLGAQYKDAGAGVFYGFGSQDQFDATRTAFFAAKYGHRWGNWGIDLHAAYRANHDRYEWHRTQSLYSNRHFAQNADVAARAHYASAIGKTTFGFDLRNEHIFSTNIGDDISPCGLFTKAKNRLNITYFAQQTFHVHGFSASLAASGIYNTMFAHHWTAGADLGYTVPLNAQRSSLTVYTNANRSLRLPTYTDLYYNAGSQLGSLDLHPEKAWTLAAGIACRLAFDRAGELSAHADVYHRWGRDIIDWVYVASDTQRPYHAANQQSVNTLGIECSVRYQLNNWLRCIEISYAYTNLDIDLVEANSRYLDHLRHKLFARVTHGIYKGLGASWTLNFRDRRGQYNDINGIVQDYTPVCLLDGELFYQFRQWRIAVECTNITNRRYYDYGGILQPGIWPKLHLTWQI